MTDKQQPEALRSLYEITGNITDHNTVLVSLAELESLRTGYAAARLEIGSLRARSAELLKALRTAEYAISFNQWHWKSYASDDMRREAHAKVTAAIHATQPAGAPQPSPA